MKASIIGGAGTVGSSSAFRIAQDGFASEVVLVDPRRNMAEAHALDIDQAVACRSGARVRAGDIADTEGSDVIVMAAAPFGRPPVTSRVQGLEANLRIVAELAPALISASPGACFIFVMAPLDVLISVMNRVFAVPAGRLTGLNGNDTARLRWAIGRTLSVPPRDVEAYVLGEHGDTQVPVFSQVRVRGEKVEFGPEERKRIGALARDFLPRWNALQPGRTAGWTTAESVGDMVTAVCSGTSRLLPCSTPLDGEYGLKGVSLGVPIRLGAGGVEKIVELDLEPGEKAALKASADALAGQIGQALALLGRSVAAMQELITSLKGGTFS